MCKLAELEVLRCPTEIACLSYSLSSPV